MISDFVDGLEVASPTVVRQATRDFAAALAMSPEFKRVEEAAAVLQDDAGARQVMLAYQEKQQALQAVLLLGALSAGEQAELETLRQSYLEEPVVAAYLRAQDELRALCQQTGAALSMYIDFDFAAACAGGCC